MRYEIGRVLKLDEIDKTADTAAKMLAASDTYKDSIDRFVKEYVYNLGSSASVGAKYLEEKTLTSTCTGVEMFRKLLDEGEAGDNVGLLLRGIDKKEVKRGMVVAKPGSITPHTKFQAEVYILKKEEGGRHTPFHNKYRPQFYLRTMDVTGEVTLPEGVDMVMPGDHVTITVELIYPVALNEGLRFAIREGGRTVGAGQILKILA